MENKLSLNQAPRPYNSEASDVTMHVHGGMTNPVSFQEFSTKLRYRSIITSLLHASPHVVRVKGAKIYRGKVLFHVTGRGFSTRRLVAFP